MTHPDRQQSKFYLMLTKIDMVHVQQGQNISVLIPIEGHPNLVKKQLYVESRSVLIDPVIDDDLFDA